MPRTYGHIPGVQIGSIFDNRVALSEAGVHAPQVAGIWGGQDGSESIVLNQGYEDDKDYGNEIIYTGHGGNDPKTKRQIADQKLTVGNLGLRVSWDQGNPIRVTRGPKAKPFNCPEGYRYDGLYQIEDVWKDTGKDGFIIYRYRLTAIPGESIDLGADVQHTTIPGTPPSKNKRPDRVEQTVSRIIRDTKLSKEIKAMHGYACQVCGNQILEPGGYYAEAAHIRALGRPHDGPDTADNILCLCPNHHVMFDRGTIWIDEDFIVQPTGTQLLGLDVNPLSQRHIEYHRDQIIVE